MAELADTSPVAYMRCLAVWGCLTTGSPTPGPGPHTALRRIPTLNGVARYISGARTSFIDVRRRRLTYPHAPIACTVCD
jgi:hypothetical protein